MTVNLTRIYTRLGDDGETHLGDMSRVPKTHPRIEAYGTVDELNSVLGCAVSELGPKSEFTTVLTEIQKQLFIVGAELATLKPTPELSQGFIRNAHVELLEKQIDEWEGELTPLTRFILPGGTKASSWLHLARTVGRRAERALVTCSHDQTLRPELIVYLNRLSDWFFVLARLLNHRAQVADILWEGILK